MTNYLNLLGKLNPCFTSEGQKLSALQHPQFSCVNNFLVKSALVFLVLNVTDK